MCDHLRPHLSRLPSLGSHPRLPRPWVCESLELTACARQSSSPTWILPSRGFACRFSHPCFRSGTLFARQDRYSFPFSLLSYSHFFVLTVGRSNVLLTLSACLLLSRCVSRGHCTLMAAFLSLKRPGTASRPLPFVMCSLSSGGGCGTVGLFPHHPPSQVWF